MSFITCGLFGAPRTRCALKKVLGLHRLMPGFPARFAIHILFYSKLDGKSSLNSLLACHFQNTKAPISCVPYSLGNAGAGITMRLHGSGYWMLY